MTTLAYKPTDRTHDNRGIVTSSELHRRDRALVDAQPMITRCGVYGCEWPGFEGTAAECHEVFEAHRASEHPTIAKVRKRADVVAKRRAESAELAKLHERRAEQDAAPPQAASLTTRDGESSDSDSAGAAVTSPLTEPETEAESHSALSGSRPTTSGSLSGEVLSADHRLALGKLLRAVAAGIENGVASPFTAAMLLEGAADQCRKTVEELAA